MPWTYFDAGFQQTLSAMRSQSVKQISLILTSSNSRGTFLGRGLFLIGLLLLRAINAKQASVRTGFAVGSYGETLVADLAVCKLTRFRSVLFFVDL